MSKESDLKYVKIKMIDCLEDLAIDDILRLNLVEYIEKGLQSEATLKESIRIVSNNTVSNKVKYKTLGNERR